MFCFGLSCGFLVCCGVDIIRENGVLGCLVCLGVVCLMFVCLFVKPPILRMFVVFVCGFGGFGGICSFV